MNEHSFLDPIQKVLAAYPQFNLIGKNEDEIAFEILESEQMKLGDKTEIIYSRRPHLKDSFLESMQNPLMVLGEKKSFFGVLSEMQAYDHNNLYDHYYTSDLRISADAIKTVKFGFRPYYKDLIKHMDKKCFTVVLKENVRAIKALTMGKSGISYTPYIPYYTTSIPVTTALKVQANLQSEKDCHLRSVKEFPKELFNKLIQGLDYAHKEHTKGENFVINIDGQDVGLVSLFRPKKRSLKIKTFSPYLKLLMKMINLKTGFDYNKKIPWVYCTQFLVRPGLDKNFIMGQVIKKLVRNKSLQSGELLLVCRIGEQVKKIPIWGPQIQTEGVVYQVALKGDKILGQTDSAHLNPLCL